MGKNLNSEKQNYWFLLTFLVIQIMCDDKGQTDMVGLGKGY